MAFIIREIKHKESMVMKKEFTILLYLQGLM
jgi:hypothetical protein